MNRRGVAASPPARQYGTFSKGSMGPSEISNDWTDSMADFGRAAATATQQQPLNRQSPSISIPGLLLLGPNRELLACNSEAVKILTFPSKPGKPREIATLMAEKLPMEKLNGGSSEPHILEFVSGKRRYVCTSHPMDMRGQNGGTTAFLLRRVPSPEVMLRGMSDRYNLTLREREALWHLLHGLTSKEIAQQMSISPNTVKAFLRQVMTKMGVNTRAGVIGRVAGVDAVHVHLPRDPS